MANLGQTMFGGGNSVYLGVLGSSGLDAALKSISLDIVSMINMETETYKEFEKEKLNWAGKRATILLKLTGNGSFVGIPEGGRLPPPGKTTLTEGEIYQKFVYGQFALSGQAIANTKSNAASLVNAIDLEQESLRDGVVFNMDRQFWGDGNGLIAKVLTYDIIDADDGTVNMSTVATDAFTNTSYMFERMKVLWGTVGELAGTPSGYGYVSSLSADGSFKVHTEGGVVPAVDDYFCLGGYDAAAAEYSSSYQNEFMGMMGIAQDAGALQGLNPATAGQEAWKAKELSFGADVTLQDEHVIRAHSLFKRFCRKTPDMVWAHPSMQTEIFKMLYGDRRFAPQDFKGGFKGKLQFAVGDDVLTFHFSDKCFRGELIFMKKDQIKYSWQQELGWMLGVFTGGRVLRHREGYDEGIGTFGGYGNMWIKNRRTILRAQGFAATVDFAG